MLTLKELLLKAETREEFEGYITHQANMNWATIEHEVTRYFREKHGYDVNTFEELQAVLYTTVTFDLGWVYVGFKDKDITKHLRKLIGSESFIYYLVMEQSTTVQSLAIEALSNILKEQHGIELTTRIVLD